jgi:hypothetical protein
VDLIPTLQPAARSDGLVFAAEMLTPLTGDLDRCRSMAIEARAISANLSVHERLHADSILIDIECRAGRFDEALDVLEEHVVGYRNERVVPCVRLQAGALLGALVAARRGNLDRTAELVAMVQPRPPRLTHRVAATRARCLIALGDTEAALAIVVASLEKRGRLARALAHVAQLEVLEASEAWDGVPAALEAAADVIPGDVLLATTVARVAGMAAAARGDPDASSHLEQAIAVADQHGLRYEAALARTALGFDVASGADREMVLAAALDALDGMGAAPAAAAIRARMAAYAPRASSS